ncbi:MAG: allantoicase [Myxococcota bacterium]
MSELTDLPDLACARFGARALAANDEFFAEKENLLKPEKPIFVEERFTDRGKWMDGWETRRRRTPGHDWCVLRLGLPGVVRGVVVDTSFFRGNYPEACGLDACAIDGDPDEATRWIELLPRSKLQGDARNVFAITCPWRVTHLRLNIHPDGGVARLRVHGEVVPAPRGGELDLAGLDNGGVVLATSDRFFGPPHFMLQPGPALGMHDGWETRRRRGPGHDWAVVRLAAEGVVARAEIDTAFFKGNFPDSCSLEACDAAGEQVAEILPRSTLRADRLHVFATELRPHAPTAHVVLRIFPDGGVARLRLWGRPSAPGRAAMALGWLNALAPAEAEATLLRCCGSRAWAQRMAVARPFTSAPALIEAAARIWRELSSDDWREAFAAHPRIGERRVADAQAAREQSGVGGASPETLAALAQGNRAYESRFGHVFLVCATGKSADEMLALLGRRLESDAETELRVAAEEQRKIAELRLKKLLEGAA